MQIKWSKKALQDLDNEILYLVEAENCDKEIAYKIYAHIRQDVDLLVNFPNMGRSGRVFGTRELVITNYPYIVPYRVKNGCIEVLCVFHTKRQLPPSW